MATPSERIAALQGQLAAKHDFIDRLERRERTLQFRADTGDRAARAELQGVLDYRKEVEMEAIGIEVLIQNLMADAQ